MMFPTSATQFRTHVLKGEFAVKGFRVMRWPSFPSEKELKQWRLEDDGEGVDWEYFGNEGLDPEKADCSKFLTVPV